LIKFEDMHDLWDTLLGSLKKTLVVLPDKPEETPENTLQALWWTAFGEPRSVEAASKLSVPDLTSLQVARLQEYIERRLSGTPLAHITGRQQFMGLEMVAGPDALIPRKETELLGGAAFGLLLDMAQRMKEIIHVDVCTGSGNLAVALAYKVPEVKGYAADLSSDAVKLARQNIALFALGERVSARTGDFLSPFDSDEFYKQIDLITCNPPYISSSKVTDMQSEISAHEPRLAFDGGPFGIKILRKLIGEAPKYLRKGGWLAFEVGLGQGEKMINIMKKKSDYCEVSPVTDEHGDIRTVLAQVN